jgi:hypothetical protein
MASAQDYADKCLEWAAAAASDQDRQILRRMALAWWRITRLTEEGQSLENLTDIFPTEIVISDRQRESDRDMGPGSRAAEPPLICTI